jgi:hypothetical protein
LIGLEPVIRAYLAWILEQNKRLDVEAIETVWGLAVGGSWASHTQPTALSGTTLEVTVPDSVWLSELRFQSERILSRLNRLLPSDCPPIERLRLVIGAPARPGRAEPARETGKSARIPLNEEQRAALETIADPGLRDLVSRVIERDTGRADKGDDPNGEMERSSSHE